MSYFYHFSSFNLKGSSIPSQGIADEYYKNTSVSVIVTEGIQQWKVPLTGKYIIEASGASGVYSCAERVAGKGAKVSSLIKLKKDENIFILVGQQGITPSSGWGGAGGGASYVAIEDYSSMYILEPVQSKVTPLVIAAGGGGSGDCNSNNTPKEGTDGCCQIKSEGGGSHQQEYASGGAGFQSDAQNSNTKSFLHGGKSYQYYNGVEYGYGGFGGGGNPCDAGGGGGGYKGGDSQRYGASGQGGYSYYDENLISCISGENEGNGYVNIILYKSYPFQTLNQKKNILQLFSYFIANLFVILS